MQKGVARCLSQMGIFRGDDVNIALPPPRHELLADQDRSLDRDLARQGRVGKRRAIATILADCVGPTVHHVTARAGIRPDLPIGFIKPWHPPRHSRTTSARGSVHEHFEHSGVNAGDQPSRPPARPRRPIRRPTATPTTPARPSRRFRPRCRRDRERGSISSSERDTEDQPEFMAAPSDLPGRNQPPQVRLKWPVC